MSKILPVEITMPDESPAIEQPNVLSVSLGARSQQKQQGMGPNMNDCSAPNVPPQNVPKASGLPTTLALMDKNCVAD